MKLKTMIGLGILATNFLIQSSIQAADVSVTDAAGLIAALADAELDPADDVIRLAAGTYATAGVPFTYSTGGAGKITLVGAGADQTFLDGENLDRVLLLLNDQGVELQGLTVFRGNTSGNGGGAGILSNSLVAITDCVFRENTATGTSGGVEIASVAGSVVIRGSQFIQNHADDGNGAANLSSGNPGSAIQIIDSVFKNNTTTSSIGALGATASNGTASVVTSRFEGNSAGPDGADFVGAVLVSAQVVIFNGNAVVANQAPGSVSGGALLASNSGDVSVIGNIFLKNIAAQGGGAMQVFAAGSARLISNTIAANQGGANVGGALILASDLIQIYNNIAYGNLSVLDTGRDILVNDALNEPVGTPVELYNNNYEFLSASCGNIPGCNSNLVEGQNLVGIDPLFVDLANNDVRLSSDSQDIDAGLASAPFIPDVDFNRNPRVFGSDPDIGALEMVSNLVLEPGELDFGQIVVGRDETRIVTVRNSETAELHVTDMILSDTENYRLDFQAGDQPCQSATPTVAGLDFCTVGVVFAPQSVEQFQGELTVTSDAANKNASVDIRGAGVPESEDSGGCGCTLSAQSSPVPPALGFVAFAWLASFGLLRYRRR